MLFLCLLVVKIQDSLSEDEVGMQPKTKKAKRRSSPKKLCKWNVIKDNTFP